MSTRAEQTMGMFGVMTLAAMAGAVTALLLAPRKGAETREQIRLKMLAARRRSQDKIDAATSKAQEGLDKIKSQTDDNVEEVSDMVSEARSQVEDSIAETKTRGRKPITPAP